MNNTNSFSWRRCFGLYRMYGRSIRRQLLLYLGLTVVVYVLVALLLNVSVGLNFMPLYAVLSMVLAFMVYVSPMVFAGRDDTMMTQLPVTPGERTVFYVGYSCVFVMLYIQVIWFVLCHLGAAVFDVGNVDEVVMSRVYETNGNLTLTPGYKAISYVSNVVQSSFLVLLSLYIVMTKRSHVFLKCLLCPVVVLMGIGVISGIAGVVIGFHEGFSALKGSDVNRAVGEQVAYNIVEAMKPVVMVLAVMTLLGCILAIYKISNRFRHPRIAH